MANHVNVVIFFIFGVNNGFQFFNFKSLNTKSPRQAAESANKWSNDPGAYVHVCVWACMGEWERASVCMCVLWVRETGVICVRILNSFLHN